MKSLVRVLPSFLFFQANSRFEGKIAEIAHLQLLILESLSLRDTSHSVILRLPLSAICEDQMMSTKKLAMRGR